MASPGKLPRGSPVQSVRVLASSFEARVRPAMMEDSMGGLSQTDKILDASNSILAKTLGDMFDESPAWREAAEGPDKRDQICELIESVKEKTSRLAEANATLFSSGQDMQHQVGELREKQAALQAPLQVGDETADAQEGEGGPQDAPLGENCPRELQEVLSAVRGLQASTLASLRAVVERCRSCTTQESLAALQAWASATLTKGLDIGSSSHQAAAERMKAWGLLPGSVERLAGANGAEEEAGDGSWAGKSTLEQLSLTLGSWTSGSISKLDVALLFMSRRILLGKAGDKWDQVDAESSARRTKAVLRAVAVLGAAELSWRAAKAAERSFPGSVGRLVKPIKPYVGLVRGACWASVLVLAAHEARKQRAAMGGASGQGEEEDAEEEEAGHGKGNAAIHPDLAAEE